MQNQTIDELSAITAVKLKDLGLSEGTVSLKRDRYFKYIVEFFHEQGELEYNDIVLYAFIDMVEGKKGTFWSKVYCSHLKSAALQIKECHDTGTLVFHTYPGKKEFNPSQEYLCILKQATESTELKPEFQYAIQGYLRRFCC
jgi:integrase